MTSGILQKNWQVFYHHIKTIYFFLSVYELSWLRWLFTWIVTSTNLLLFFYHKLITLFVTFNASSLNHALNFSSQNWGKRKRKNKQLSIKIKHSERFQLRKKFTVLIVRALGSSLKISLDKRKARDIAKAVALTLSNQFHIDSRGELNVFTVLLVQF